MTGIQGENDLSLPSLSVFARNIGITRLADLTGLDIIGIPVVQTVRPASRSNIVSQGKGATLGQATCSAVLEAAESFFAERLDRYDSVKTTASALGIPRNIFAQHLISGAPPQWQDTTMHWVPAVNPLSGKNSYVPLSLVHTCFTEPPALADDIFIATTTGLAAGLTREWATTHAVLETVERDALAKAHRVHGFFQRARIDASSIADAGVQSLLQDLRDRGFLVGLWLVPSAIGIPVIWCHLMEDCNPLQAIVPYPSEGTAAHFDLAQAIISAVHEAAQSRLTAIAGARDDFTRCVYPAYPDVTKIASHRRVLAYSPASIYAENIETGAGVNLAELLSLLAQEGFSDIREVAIRTDPKTEIAVVKVLISGLEPFFEKI